jgi:hypothetical protein
VHHVEGNDAPDFAFACVRTCTSLRSLPGPSDSSCMSLHPDPVSLLTLPQSDYDLKGWIGSGTECCIVDDECVAAVTSDVTVTLAGGSTFSRDAIRMRRPRVCSATAVIRGALGVVGQTRVPCASQVVPTRAWVASMQAWGWPARHPCGASTGSSLRLPVPSFGPSPGSLLR